MSLSIAKYIEIKTNKSIKSVIKELKKITDAKLYDQINKREIIKRSKINNETKNILDKLEMS